MAHESARLGVHFHMELSGQSKVSALRGLGAELTDKYHRVLATECRNKSEGKLVIE